MFLKEQEVLYCKIHYNTLSGIREENMIASKGWRRLLLWIQERKQAKGRVQAEHGCQTKPEYERKGGEREKEKSP